MVHDYSVFHILRAGAIPGREYLERELTTYPGTCANPPSLHPIIRSAAISTTIGPNSFPSSPTSYDIATYRRRPYDFLKPRERAKFNLLRGRISARLHQDREWCSVWWTPTRSFHHKATPAYITPLLPYLKLTQFFVPFPPHPNTCSPPLLSPLQPHNTHSYDLPLFRAPPAP